MIEAVKRLKIPRIDWRRKDLYNFGYWFVSFLIWEFGCHFICYKGFSASSLYIIPFSALCALIFAYLTRLGSERVNRGLTLGLTILLMVVFSAQIVYHRVFGSFFSIKMIKLGGTAMTRFWKETAIAILSSWWKVFIFSIPIVLHVLRAKHMPKTFCKRVRDFNLIFVGLIVLFWAGCVFSLRLGGTKRHTAFGAYHSSTIVTNESVNRLGMMTTMRLETGQLLFPPQDNSEDYQLVVTRLPKVETAESSSAASTYAKNVLSIDFENLDTYSYDERVQALNKYFSYAKGTSKNRYTGYFRGCNLIELCCESYSPIFITEDLTPALYQLTHQGFLFNNYYTSFSNTTTNCEYAFCMGMFPDLTRNKWDGSFVQSTENYLPYCVGNAFRNLGYNTYFFHNNVGSFYQRNNSHPNMGFECWFRTEGTETIEEESLRPDVHGMPYSTEGDPTSDLEMIQKSLPIILEKDEPFVAYYMTYSGHYPYDFSMNPMAEKNRETVDAYLAEKGIEYSDIVKAYISCNLELEYALEYLMQELEKQGILDETVIVLTGDHYPYGLVDYQYDELAGMELTEPFDRKKNSFVCWAGFMADQPPVSCNTYCSNIDILPTILNLFGIKYDSRLLAGVDVFSDGPHMAILTDESFITDVMMYDSTNNAITYFVDENLVPDNYFDSAVQLIQNKMNQSNLMLYTNYFDLVYHPSSYDSANGKADTKVPIGYIVILVLVLLFVVLETIRYMKYRHRRELERMKQQNETAKESDQETVKDPVHS